MARLSRTTIDKFPGTLARVARCSAEELKIYADEFTSPNDNSEYKVFVREYFYNNTRLKDIPEITGIPESKCSAWAADIIGTICEMVAKKRSEEKRKAHDEDYGCSTTNSGSGFDIYEYAKKFDADYYDPNTGYIYLVQQYNRAIRFGLPTPGILVVEDGKVIGTARKMN